MLNWTDKKGGPSGRGGGSWAPSLWHTPVYTFGLQEHGDLRLQESSLRCVRFEGSRPPEGWRTNQKKRLKKVGRTLHGGPGLRVGLVGERKGSTRWGVVGLGGGRLWVSGHKCVTLHPLGSPHDCHHAKKFGPDVQQFWRQTHPVWHCLMGGGFIVVYIFRGLWGAG